MKKCNARRNLEVHHRSRNGGNKLNNAQVLCRGCHSQTNSYGKAGESPKPFSDTTKKLAVLMANYQCQCRGCLHCITHHIRTKWALRKLILYYFLGNVRSWVY